MKISTTLLGLVLPVLSIAASLAPHVHSHNEELGKRLPSSWHHPPGHPAYALFRRDVQTDGTTYATVGSTEWSAPYPPSKPDPSQYPQAWVDALNNAVQAGLIPDIPPSTMDSNGLPVYSDGLDATGPEVCSATYKCQNATTDIWDAPDGVFGAGFDDGPLPTSTALYQFLHENNVRATHFMIGVNIVQNPDEFTMAFETNNDDIAVHTWTHPYMTTLDNMQVLGELGWTMQLIHNSTGGRLPRYWRPPYGDADNRVRAIAQEVFGLTTIIWNHDTEDWSLTTGGTTPDQVQASLEKWLTGPKSPGLIILEHELSNMSVQAFIDAFPLIGQNGWDIVSVTELNNSSPYQNAQSSTSSVQPVDSVLSLNGTADSDALISAGSNVTTSTTTSGTSSVLSNAVSQSPSTTSSTQHPAASTLAAQTQKSSGAMSNGIPLGSLELVTVLALISAAVSLI